MEGTLNFWKTCSKKDVMPFVPPNIYDQIETEGPYVDGVHIVVKQVFDVKGFSDVTDLLSIQEDDLKALVDGLPGVSDVDIKRVQLAIHLYRLLYQKYHLGFTEMDSYLAQLQSSGLPGSGKAQKRTKGKRRQTQAKGPAGLSGQA